MYESVYSNFRVVPVTNLINCSKTTILCTTIILLIIIMYNIVSTVRVEANIIVFVVVSCV